jgi:phosphoserine phosphatase
MNGELDFSASLKERVGLLKGVPADVFDKLKSVITIAKGARELCRALKALGFKMAVLSGGFQPLAEWLAGQLGLDYAVANHVSRPITYLSDPWPILTLFPARNRPSNPNSHR